MSIVVVAKAPLPGRSKTRLIPLLGEEGSVQVAEAMLSDVLVAISVRTTNFSLFIFSISSSTFSHVSSRKNFKTAKRYFSTRPPMTKVFKSCIAY